MDYQIILASGSPRRKEILSNVGVRFQVVVSECDESSSQSEPAALVLELSRRKAEAVADGVVGPAVIIGADTVVAYENTILGKPKSEKDAERMLSLIAGKIHQVVTGVTLLIIEETQKRKIVNFSKSSFVKVYPMNIHQIKSYLSTGESMDKAGAYAIQGRFAPYIEEIQGDYYNIVGLPLAEVYQRLYQEKIDLLTGKML